MVLFCFFVFKRKTAYVVRISDWVSDVCSADLWLFSEDTVLGGSPRFAVLGVGDHNWADTYQAVPIRIDQRLNELGALPLVPRAAADTSGVGRASCRERVCQYV